MNDEKEQDRTLDEIAMLARILNRRGIDDSEIRGKILNEIDRKHCPHERLNEEGYCRQCGGDFRGITGSIR